MLEKLRRLDAADPDLKLEKEARGIDNCGVKAAAFECMGQLELWEGESVNRRHRLEKRVRCKRDFCSGCGEYDSTCHQERASRLYKNLWEIRLEKWVVTFADSDIPSFRTQKSLGRAMRAIYDVVANVTGAEGAIISLHVMGDESDRYRPHFEVMIPSDGTGYARAELDRVREELREGIQSVLGLQEPANAHFGYISKGYPAKRQQNMWFHSIRYAVHPVVGAERFLRLPDEEAVFIVLLLRKLRRVRGYGCFGDRRIKSSAEDLRARFPIALEGEPEEEPKVGKGLPCPGCGAELKHQDMGRALLAGGREIAPDLYMFEYVETAETSYLKSLEGRHAHAHAQGEETEDRETPAVRSA